MFVCTCTVSRLVCALFPRLLRAASILRRASSYSCTIKVGPTHNPQAPPTLVFPPSSGLPVRAPRAPVFSSPFACCAPKKPLLFVPFEFWSQRFLPLCPFPAIANCLTGRASRETLPPQHTLPRAPSGTPLRSLSTHRCVPGPPPDHLPGTSPRPPPPSCPLPLPFHGGGSLERRRATTGICL